MNDTVMDTLALRAQMDEEHEANLTLRSKALALRAQLDKVVAGYTEIKDMVIVCLLADGHVLLEAVPGTAKTTLVNTLRAAIKDGQSARIQMTPDLKPNDITGMEVFNPAEQKWSTRLGPMVRANLLLADEINRTTPKTLAALLEAMQERQVTIGGVTYTLPALFMMLATRNPLESEGVYPLPEAATDRFLMLLVMNYVSKFDEIKMLHNLSVHGRKAQSDIDPVVSIDELLEMQRAVVAMCERATFSLLEYIVDLTRATRPGRNEQEIAYFNAVHGADAETLRAQISFGASPRCEIAMLHCAAALAFYSGDRFIEPKHVKAVFDNVARHRIILTDEAIHDGVTPDEVITKVLSRVKVVTGEL